MHYKHNASSTGARGEDALQALLFQVREFGPRDLRAKARVVPINGGRDAGEKQVRESGLIAMSNSHAQWLFEAAVDVLCNTRGRVPGSCWLLWTFVVYL